MKSADKYLKGIVAIGLGLYLATFLFSFSNVNVAAQLEAQQYETPDTGCQPMRVGSGQQQQLQQDQKQQEQDQEEPQQREEATLAAEPLSPYHPIPTGNPKDCIPDHPFFSADQLYDLIQLWYVANCPANIPKYKRCKFRSIGRYLLSHAIQYQKTLLTVQIGAMDGKSNDPLYEMFVTRKEWDLRRSVAFPDLSNWLPILLEPVPQNYEKLVKTYQDITEQHGLKCALPMNAAISYDSNVTSCAFCRYNLSPDAPEECSHADWMKTQIGTLDCSYSRRFFGARIFEKCILKDPLPCGPVKKLMYDRAPYMPENTLVAMVQIDVEAYEYILLEGLLHDLDPLPPVIHFENKVMKNLDRKKPLESGENRLQMAFDSLTKVGYQIYEEGEDTLAFLLPPGIQSTLLQG